MNESAKKRLDALRDSVYSRETSSSNNDRISKLEALRRAKAKEREQHIATQQKANAASLAQQQSNMYGGVKMNQTGYSPMTDQQNWYSHGLERAQRDLEAMKANGASPGSIAAQEAEVKSWQERLNNASARVSEDKARPVTGLERALLTLEASGKNYAGTLQNTGGFGLETLGKLNDAAFETEYADEIRAAKNSHDYWTKVLAETQDEAERKRAQMALERANSTLQNIADLKELQSRAVDSAAGRVYEKADKKTEEAEQLLQKAKYGASDVGQFLVDIGYGGSQLAADVGIGLATGGGAMIPMAARVFGGSTQEARRAGASYEQQLGYGAASTTLSVGTEKLFSLATPLSKAFGGGMADDTVKALAGKLNGSAAGRLVLNALSEGSEEMIEAIVDPQLKKIYDSNAGYDADTISNVLYSGLLGAVLGGGMGSVGEVMDARSAKANYGESARELAEESLALDPKNRTAKRTIERLDKNKSVSGAMLNNMVRQNEATMLKRGITEETMAEEERKARGEYTEEESVQRMIDALTSESATEEEMDAAAAKLEGYKVDEAVAKERRKVAAQTMAKTYSAPVSDFTEEEAQYVINEGAKEFGNAASSVVNSYVRGQDPQLYMAQAKLAFNYGKTMSEEKGLPYALKSSSLKSLDETQIRSLFNAGRMQAKSIPVSAVKGTGKAVLTGGLDYSLLSPAQQKQYNALAAFVKASGYTIEFFESKAGEDGRYTAEQGSFNTKTGVIRIDINAGRNAVTDLSNYALVRVASHEITHSFKKNAPQQYVALRDYVTGVLADKGEFDDLVDTKMRDLGIDHETAVDEVVADGCEMLLRDTRFAEQLAKENRTLFENIRDAIRKFVKKLRDAFDGVEIAHEEAALLKDAENLQKLWDEALSKSVENVAAAEEVGFDIDTTTESVAASLHSERTWTESEYVQQRTVAAKEIAKAIGVSEQKALDYIDSVNSIAKMIAEDRTRLDYFSSPYRSSFVSNVEYGGSFDFSTLCKKRRLLTGTFTAIQKALPNTALTANEILDIRNRMKEAGLEVSCGLCYVEGSRANMGQFAKEFIRLYKQYYPDAWHPNMADVNTPDGIEWVRINHPECYEQYEYFWNHYGTLRPGDKNLFASQQKPKLYQLHTEYKGEVLEKFKGEENIAEKNRNGGIRMQSFSDFEIVHLIDCMQIIMDMSRVGLAGQAYTKVPDFAWAMGDTGMKINLSLIAKGVDENGKLIFDDVEGMPIEEAMKLRDRYSKNVGTILVAFNDEQLYAAMADERVDFIIPFHRSQWKKSQYTAMGLPAKTKDYTFMQNEKFIKPQYHEYRGKQVKDKATNYMPNEYWDFSKSGKENAIAYLEMCAKNNKRPKFYKLLQNNGDGSYSLKADGSTDGYWKLLIDFKMYDNDGVGSPQTPVRPDFNMEEATRMLNEYKGGHSQFPVAQGIVDEFVEEYKGKHGVVMYSKRDSEYMSAVESGDMETAQKMVDEAAMAALSRSAILHPDGGLMTVFHATPHKFTVFDANRAGSENGIARGKGFYFSPYKSVAGSYTGNIGQYFLNITNPFDYDTADKDVIVDLLEKSGYEYDKDFVDNFDDERLEFDADLIDDFLADALIGVSPDAVFSDMVKKAGYDGIWAWSSDEIIAFFPEQVKSADPVTYDDDGKVIPLSQRFSPGNDDIRFSFRAGYIPADRSILASYVPKDSDSDMIKRHIAEYQKSLEELRKLEQTLREQREQMRSFNGNENKLQRAKLREEIAKTQNRIQIANDQLRRKENWMGVRTVLKREKDALVKQAKAEEREKLTKYREKRWDTETRRKMRERISYRVKTLDKMLREPTDDKHIPEELRKAVFDFCEVFQDEVGVFSQKQLDRLNVAYAFLAEEHEGVNASYLYDEDIKEMISQLGLLMDGKRLSELSVEALRFVHNIADHMYFIVRDENEVFLNGRKVKMQTIATKAIEEAKESEKKGGLTIGRDGEAFAKFLTSGNLKPVYLFERTGDQLRDLFNGLLAGQSEYGRREQKAKAFVEQVKKDTNYSEWSSSEETLKMTNGAGQQIELTVQQAMSLLATYERELRQGLFHVTKGGFVYENGVTGDVTVKGVKVPVVKRKVEAEAHPMTADDMDKVRQWLGSIDSGTLDYMERMVEYLSTTMAAYGNETSMQLHGYKKFSEGYYFPIRSSDDYLNKDPGKGGFDENRWKNKGFTKALTKSANNPFVLIDFDKVWSNHVSQMLMYSTMAVPQESFVRVLNFKTPVDPTGLSNSESMRSVIKQYYGSKVADYIDTLLRDVNGGVTTDSRATVLNRLVSTFKKNATFASASVVVQQISSVARATALIAPKHFAGGNPVDGFKEALEHSGVAVIKQMGGFDTTTGRGGAEWLMEETPEGFKNKAKAFVRFGEKDTGYRDRIFSALPAKMDELGFGMIWNAAKNEVFDSGKYEDGTDAFYEAVTKRFEEVIEKTQVYDSVLSRSENMRGKDGLLKAATSFMAEPTVTANMMMDAAWKLTRNKDTESGKYLGRVVASLVLAMLANNLLKAAATAPRDKDEDQTILEKYVEDVAGGIKSDINPFGYVPILRDIKSIWEGYTVEASYAAPIADAIDAFKDVRNDGSFDNWVNLVVTSSGFIGLPLKNLKRDLVDSVINLFGKTANISESSWRGTRNAILEGWDKLPGVDDAIEKAYKADKRGNEAQRKKALDEIVRLYEDKAKQFRLEGKQDAAKKAKSSLKSSITAELKPLYQAATTQAEKNRIKSLALRVYVGGEQLYNGYDFERYWGEE